MDEELRTGKKLLGEVANNKVVKKILLIPVVVVSVALFIWWVQERKYEKTDNAYVMADIATLSSRIPGKIKKIHVENDDYVKEGDLLVEIDEEDYALKVQQIASSLEALREEYKLRQINLSYIESNVTARLESARADLNISLNREQQAQKKIEELEEKRKALEVDFKHYEKDFQRFEALYGEKAIPERELDRTRTSYKKAKAQLEALNAELASARIALNSARKDTEKARAQLKIAEADELNIKMEQHRIKNLEAQIKKVEAELELAKLQLSYCKIEAPISGYIAQKRIQIGDWVQPGQPLMAIVPLDEIYIEANFKETQLRDIRIGQKAKIKADIYPGYQYEGRVVGIRSGTGVVFSLLPPENATGNWIKVVQRVPVKIKLDNPPPPEYPLRVGLSLEVKVDTSDKSGPRIKEARLNKEAVK